MDRSVAVLIGIAAGVVAGIVIFALYRWQQRRRVRRVEKWVKGWLSARYGELPTPLHIDCSDDRLWPVLVNFDTPGTGIRHRLQFACPGPGSALSLISDIEEKR